MKYSTLLCSIIDGVLFHNFQKVTAEIIYKLLFPRSQLFLDVLLYLHGLF